MEASTTTADWLNYHHLRYFYAVAKEGSVRKAAEVLSISQPSICAQVKLLESALGESLFRRSGRSLVLTDFGQVILGYAEEIFTLGRELLGASTQVPTIRSLRLQVGIVDSFPKLLSFDILRPAFTHQPPAQLSCREGKLDDLLGQLAAHRLDAVLADEPPPSSTKIKTFNHALASSGVTFCATPSLARQLVGKFPRNLHGTPALLPTQNTTLRRDLEKWFRDQKIEPKVVAEFEDAALATIVATEGVGFTVVPTIIVAEAVGRYGFVPLGKTEACQIRLYLITAERRMDHPLVQALAQHAAASLSHRAAGRRRKNAKLRKSARP